jgi:hypothetical protein
LIAMTRFDVLLSKFLLIDNDSSMVNDGNK